MYDKSSSTDELFEDLEKEFQKVESSRRRNTLLSGLVFVVGLVLILVGLSTNIFVSFLGYALMFLAAWFLVERVKEKAAFRFREIVRKAFGF